MLLANFSPQAAAPQENKIRRPILWWPPSPLTSHGERGGPSVLATTLEGRLRAAPTPRNEALLASGCASDPKP